MSRFEQDVTGIGTLADPTRRALYLFVCDQTDPVSRDQAADAVGVARHQAKFHLDRLEEQGLLDSGYARTSGRTGPGAGRTAKLYRRSDREIAVSLPDREYELAGRLMAEAIAESADSTEPTLSALDRAAAAHGRSLGSAAGVASPSADPLDTVIPLLRDNGYQPRREGRTVVLANCPFHGLVRTQPELVCRMNAALLGAVAAETTCGRLVAELSPAPDRCCVVLSPADRSAAQTPE